MYNEFTVINRCMSSYGTIIHFAPVRELRTNFGAKEEDIAAAYNAQRWEEVRTERSNLLAECDWVVTKYAELGEAVPTEWVEYRQALRDITNQEDPDDITWPTSP